MKHYHLTWETVRIPKLVEAAEPDETSVSMSADSAADLFEEVAYFRGSIDACLQTIRGLLAPSISAQRQRAVDEELANA